MVVDHESKMFWLLRQKEERSKPFDVSTERIREIEKRALQNAWGMCDVEYAMYLQNQKKQKARSHLRLVKNDED